MPNAIPGSSVMLIASDALASDHDGRTRNLPTRIGVTVAFHASSQSWSSTVRTASSPIGPSPNACRWPSASRASATFAKASTSSTRYAFTV